MINIQKLVKYIENAPFKKTEKDRLITLACVADEEHKRHIYVLVKEFTERIEAKKSGKISAEKVRAIQSKAQKFRGDIRKKGEEIYHQAENSVLTDLETQISLA